MCQCRTRTTRTTPEGIIRQHVNPPPGDIIYTSTARKYAVDGGSALVMDSGDTASWVQAAAESALKHAPVACIVPVRTNTRYWHKYILNNQSAVVHFVQGRLVFPGHKQQSPSASALVVFEGPYENTTYCGSRLRSCRPRTVMF